MTNLFVLDQSKFVFSASLPVACKELYDNISHCNLNYNEEPESVLLSDAIRYSIETEGCLLNKKLEDKATEFGDFLKIPQCRNSSEIPQCRNSSEIQHCRNSFKI
jgi:hypothetical protein